MLLTFFELFFFFLIKGALVSVNRFETSTHLAVSEIGGARSRLLVQGSEGVL